jgi:putative membrane protein
MIIEFVLALIMGIVTGTITGLTPGIHINLIAIILLGFSATILTFSSPLSLAIFITAMAITHTFVDYIPSIFLGAPDEDSVLSVLPGHTLLLKGRAYPAVVLTLYGGLTALLIILLFTPLFIYILPKIHNYIVTIMPLILILASGYLIFLEKKKRLWALIIFLLAGLLGISALNSNLKEPLLPLLTGLFGASNIIMSIKNKTKIPKQKIFPLKKIRLRKKSFGKATLASIIAAPLTSFLPGLGSAQAAVIGSEIIGDEKSGKLNSREFLFLLGAINTIVMGLSFITLYSIQKTRTGAAVAISKLTELTLPNTLTILATIVISGILAFFITILLTKLISRHITRIKYRKLSLIILSLLLIVILIFSEDFIISLIIFISSTTLGITAILLGIRRMHLMGSLLIPTILFYLL